jgi:hypothetical protein
VPDDCKDLALKELLPIVSYLKRDKDDEVLKDGEVDHDFIRRRDQEEEERARQEEAEAADVDGVLQQAAAKLQGHAQDMDVDDEGGVIQVS